MTEKNMDMSMLIQKTFPKDSKVFLTEAEAAEQLGMARKALYEYRKQRKIDFTRIGGKVYYTPQHIQKYIDRNTFKAKADLQ